MVAAVRQLLIIHCAWQVSCFKVLSDDPFLGGSVDSGCFDVVMYCIYLVWTQWLRFETLNDSEKLHQDKLIQVFFNTSILVRSASFLDTCTWSDVTEAGVPGESSQTEMKGWDRYNHFPILLWWLRWRTQQPTLFMYFYVKVYVTSLSVVQNWMITCVQKNANKTFTL